MFRLSKTNYFKNKKERERARHRRGARNSYDDAVEHEVKHVECIPYVRDFLLILLNVIF